MDITLQLKKGNVDNNYQERGDIVDVLRTPADTSTLSPGVKFYYIHITGVPDVSPARAKRLRAKLRASDEVDTGEIDDDGFPVMDLRNRRVWSVPAGALPPSARNVLRTTGELTATWSQVKPFVRRKLRQIRRDDTLNNSDYDPNDSVPIIDEDVTSA